VGKRRRTRLSGFESLEDRIVFNTYWASNLNDSGAGSLRDAIESANGHAGADDVRFREEMKGTITLSSELSITDSLNIHGRGSDKLTVSGGGTNRVINIAAGADVTIEHLTIANGFVKDGNGAGILNGGNLQVLDSLVSGNSARGFRSGGGITNLGNLTIQHSRVTGNTAERQGGGIWNLGKATIQDSQIDNNSVPFGGGGGLMNSYSGDMTLNHVLVTKNIALSEGAGINSGWRSASLSKTKLTIDNSTISENSTPCSFCTSGLIWESDQDLTIRDTKIQGNIGQAAVFLGYASTGNVLISRSEVTDNVSTWVGGIWGFESGITRIEDTTIRNNVGVYAGGIFYNGTSPFEIVRSTISDNHTNACCSLGAGGILGGVQLINSTVSGNTVVADQAYLSPYFPAGFAGGMLATGYGGNHASVENSTITDNRVLNAPAGAQSAGGLLGFNFVFDFYYYPGGTHYYGNYPANVPIRNTIIAKNENLGGDADVSGSFVSQGHNLIGILGAGATGFVDSDLRGTSDAPLDPLLDPLADNGGWTKTHMLRRGSPAIDAGDSSNSPASDQRGYARIIGDAIDIGSVEWKSHPLDPQELAQERGAQPVLATLSAATSTELSRPPTRASSTPPLQGMAAAAQSSRARPQETRWLSADRDDPKLKLRALDDLFASLTADGF
jgi:hypothetical protein